MTFFFDVAYAAVIVLGFALAGSLPGWLMGFVAPRQGRRLLLPGVALAIAGWIWIGWLGEPFGISRLGLVVFAAVGAAGFVYGWSTGLRAGARARARRPRRPSIRP